MNANDKRHGSHAGYIQGCRCKPCRDGHYRANKERWIYRTRHGSCRIDYPTWSKLVAHWTDQGFSIHALCDAAGFGTRTDLAKVLAGRQPINRATFAGLLNVTEDDFSATAKIPAQLTRDRIYSLMAAGHRLSDMPIPIRGNWRIYDQIVVGSARDIRAYYRENETRAGSSKLTASRALNAGHQPPAAWDDPGTLAWPVNAERPTLRLVTTSAPTVAERIAEHDWLISHGTAAEEALARTGFTSAEHLRQSRKRTGKKAA